MDFLNHLICKLGPNPNICKLSLTLTSNLISDLEAEASLALAPGHRRQLEEVSTHDELDSAEGLRRPPH